MQTLNIGLIGAGAIADVHCLGFNSHPNARVVAVADTSIERRAALAARHGSVAKTYSSAEELIADDSIQAVSIAIPNALHAPVATLALAAGKHVMLEKPFARTFDEASQIAQAARRSDRVLMVGMNNRYTPSSRWIRARVAAGELGEIYHAKACWMRHSGIPKLGTWFGRMELSGGGAMLDIGVHMLDLTMHLMDNFDPVSVSAMTYGKFGHRGLGEGDWGRSDKSNAPFDVEDFATALIRFKNGATLSLDAAWAIHQSEQSRQNIHLFGTDAGATVFPEAKLIRYSESGEHLTVEPRLGTLGLENCRFCNFVDAVLDVAEPCCTVEEALKVQRVIDAIYRSARESREVPVEPESSTRETIHSVDSDGRRESNVATN